MNKRITIWTLAVMLSCSSTAIFSSCCDDDLSNSSDSTPFNPYYDHMDVKVTSDMPTAVLSSFDDKSMGAALQRRLSKTTTSIQADTKMVLIKGEDIKSRPITEWFEAAKIYLKGGYIAVEKPRDAHMVDMMERLSTQFAMASYDILIDNDDDSGVKFEIEKSDDQSSSNSINADAAQMSTRIANIEAMSTTSNEDNAPVAEMVIFSRKGYYQCAPYGTKTISTTTTKKDGTKTTQSHTITQGYNLRYSGFLADGAAEWINEKNSGKVPNAKSRLISKADGNDAINELMSASEEHTYQTALLAQVPTMDYDCYPVRPATKDNGFKEIVRVWGVHNMNNNKDYYCIDQKITASVGGKKDNYTYVPVSPGPEYHAETLYLGPYKENEWDVDFYGAWFNNGDFSINMKGNGDIKLEDAIPDTDNNNVSRSVAVGETHSETNTIGFSIGGMLGKAAAVTGSFNYSHGWTDGTSFTLTTTSNAKELKCVKNTDGTTAKWQYSCGTDMMAGDDDEHPLAPDALTNDVDIDNQVCYSVNNPSGAYTIDVFHKSEMASLYVPKDDKEELTASTAENDDDAKIRYTLAVPNRAKQVWTMDVTFPEIAEEGYNEVKPKLTAALQNQFPDLYQPHLELADQTEESENTIAYIFNCAKNLITDPNVLQTLKEYAMTYKISEYTIKWYNSDHKVNQDTDSKVKHQTYKITIKAK